MKRLAGTTAALLATTAMAQAGGIERDAQSPAILFEDGTYVELSYSWVNPDVSGEQVETSGAASPAGSLSGDVSPSYGFASLSYRQNITEDVSFAIILDQPVGADVDYNGITPPGYLYRFGAGSQAEINSQALTAALRYEMPSGMSVYGGFRAVEVDGEVSLFPGSAAGTGTPTDYAYSMEADGSTELGYMLGVAYEVPEIALRVALTYYSETTHTFEAVESLTSASVAAANASFETKFETTIPQHILLEAQTGVAEGTLVFGSIRWTEWTAFDIIPDVFSDGTPDEAFGGRSLVDYDDDVWTYQIGGARILTNNWTVLGSLTYEPQNGGFSGNLGPTDGRTSLGIGARFTQGPVRITGGVNYTWIGDAETESPVTAGTQFATFEDNNAIGFGLQIGYSF